MKLVNSRIPQFPKLVPNPILRRATLNLRRWVILVTMIVFSGAVIHSQAQTQIPGTFVLPSSAADTNQPGFIWRVHQVDSWQPNENSRTEKQLAGLLGANVANPEAQGGAISPASPADPSTAPIQFDLSGVLNLSISGSENAGNFFPDDPFPGLPGTTGSTDNVAAEILTWLDLPAGTITMGVNSDDGFRMNVGGANPIDKFAPEVAAFNGGRGATDTLFTITVAKAGLHAVRCTWEQGGGGANIELFTVKSDGTKVLLNDTANGGVPAYRAITVPARAYARKVSPAPNSTSASANAPIIVELVDGVASIDPTTIALALDGVVVAVVPTKTGNVTTVAYVPTSNFVEGSQHSVVFSYEEEGAVVQVPWRFTVINDFGPNGHRYEVVLVDGGITWPDAKAAAENRGTGGGVAHLATITSMEEDLFLERLRQSSKPDREDGQLWVGGYQQKDSPDYWESQGGWVWLNDEGPIDWYNWGYPYGTYANWQPGQPDNAWGGEDYLAIGLYDSYGWNDDGVNAGGRFDGTLGGYIVEYEPIILAIDIKPGDSKNEVNLVSNGKLPVAVISTAAFNASLIDTATVRFGRTGIEATPVKTSLQDVNGDGKMDLVSHFNMQDTELIGDDIEAILTARTTTRIPVQGRDSIQVVASPHYTLTATAMQDVNKITDLELAVQSLTNNAITPAVASSVQLKSFDAVGKLGWTKNFANVPLQQQATSYSVGSLQFSDALARQPVKVKMLLPYNGGLSMETIYGETVVRLRPDLAVEKLVVPTTAALCQVVNIVATIRELNGDLGATANAYLYDGDQIIDYAAVWIDPQGSADVVFARIFEGEGTHALKVVVQDVAPGDYDPANNSALTSVEIGGFAPVQYSVSYYRQSFEYQDESQNPYSSSFIRQSGSSESLSAGFSLTPYLQFPFQDVAIQLTADGVVGENIQLGAVSADYEYSDAGYYYGYAYRELGNGTYIYFTSTSSGCCSCSSSVYANLYRPSADIVYHSVFHDFYWGTTETYDSVEQNGTLLNAVSSLEIRFTLQHEEGTFGGTTGSMPVTEYPYYFEWNNVWPDYGFSRGYDQRDEYSVYSGGTLTP